MGILEMVRRATKANGSQPKPLNFLVTLWPSFPHFRRFASDPRIQGIRLNSAMVELDEIEKELALCGGITKPLYFDIKGKQLRVVESHVFDDHLELEINHPISVKTPTLVLFKAGEDGALLRDVVDGTRLVFEGGPKYLVHRGESLHIRDKDLEVHGETFTPLEIEKTQRVVAAGFTRYCLSYAENQRQVDEFRELIGKDAELIIKVENARGLEYVATQFRKDNRTSLMAARGDLYVEVDRPHQITDAMRLIVAKDPNAFVGSRLLLSMVNRDVPDCSDISDLAWLYDLGYRNMMMCDEICLKEHLLSRSVNVFDSFRKTYSKT